MKLAATAGTNSAAATSPHPAASPMPSGDTAVKIAQRESSTKQKVDAQCRAEAVNASDGEGRSDHGAISEITGGKGGIQQAMYAQHTAQSAPAAAAEARQDSITLVSPGKVRISSNQAATAAAFSTKLIASALASPGKSNPNRPVRLKQQSALAAPKLHDAVRARLLSSAPVSPAHPSKCAPARQTAAEQPRPDATAAPAWLLGQSSQPDKAPAYVRQVPSAGARQSAAASAELSALARVIQLSDAVQYSSLSGPAVKEPARARQVAAAEPQPNAAARQGQTVAPTDPGAASHARPQNAEHRLRYLLQQAALSEEQLRQDGSPDQSAEAVRDIVHGRQQAAAARGLPDAAHRAQQPGQSQPAVAGPASAGQHQRPDASSQQRHVLETSAIEGGMQSVDGFGGVRDGGGSADGLSQVPKASASLEADLWHELRAANNDLRRGSALDI